MTSIFTSDIWEQNRVIVIYALVILGVVLLLGVGLSRGIVALLRGSLKGHHPTELLELYLKQEDVLNAIEDGLVATDREGTIIFSNQAAQRLLGGFPGGTWRGGQMEEVFPESACVQAASTGQTFHNRSCVIGERQVLASEVHSGRRGTGRRAECAA